MDDEVYSFALKNALNEIRNICPDIVNTFIFTEDGVLAGDDNTSEKTAMRVMDAIDGILERTEALGGFEGLVFEGGKNRVDVSSLNGLYLVTITSGKADMKYVNTVTRVLIPTVLKLLEKIHPTPLKGKSPRVQEETQITTRGEIKKAQEEAVGEAIQEETIEPKTPSPQPTANQFIVENLGGLFAPSDVVRIDSDLILQWEELYQDNRIEEVEIETFNGKTMRCKVKPIKDSKHERKGIIQIPEKIQLVLEIKKGELVRVKPAIE